MFFDDRDELKRVLRPRGPSGVQRLNTQVNLDAVMPRGRAAPQPAAVAPRSGGAASRPGAAYEPRPPVVARRKSPPPAPSKAAPTDDGDGFVVIDSHRRRQNAMEADARRKRSTTGGASDDDDCDDDDGSPTTRPDGARGGPATRVAADDSDKSAAESAAALDKMHSQLEQRELLHACDVLEQLLADDLRGFDVDLYLACRQFVASNRAAMDAESAAMSRFAADGAGVAHNKDDDDDDDDTEATSLLPGVITTGFGEVLDDVREREMDARANAARAADAPWHRKWTVFLENPSSSAGATTFYVILSFLVLLNCLLNVIETLPQLNPTVRPDLTNVWLYLDWTFTIFFSMETLARLVATVYDDSVGSAKCQNAVGFFKRPSNLLDIVSLLPTYLQGLFSSGRVLTGSLRTLRLLRLLKFLRRFPPIRVLLMAMQRAAPSLVAPFCFLFMSLLLLGSMQFFAEKGTWNESQQQFNVPVEACSIQPVAVLNASFTCPETESLFISMLQALWWGIVTMATVGFGDIAPVTTWGKVIAAVTMICGVLFVVMPIAVIGTNYTIVAALLKKREVKREEMAAMRSGLSDQRTLLGDTPMPGEIVLAGIRQLLTNDGTNGSQRIDLRAPSPRAVFCIDAVLEVAMKQLVNVSCRAKEIPAPFVDFVADMSIPLWTATVDVDSNLDAAAPPGDGALANSSSVVLPKAPPRWRRREERSQHVLRLGAPLV